MSALSDDETQTIRKLVAGLFQAYNTGDAERAAAIYGEEATHAEAALQRRSTGRDAIRKGLERFFAMFPDARWDVHRVIADEHAAAVTYRLTGSLHRDLGQIPGNGQPLDIEGVLIATTADGQILTTTDYWDAQTFMKQMQA